MTISTYDYKFIDLKENEVLVDLHFKSISKNKILMTLDQKDTHKSYYNQSSKVLSDMFMNGFIKSISRNISSPITNLLGAIDLIKLKNNADELIYLLFTLVLMYFFPFFITITPPSIAPAASDPLFGPVNPKQGIISPLANFGR